MTPLFSVPRQRVGLENLWLAKKPHHNQETRHSNDELAFVVKATMQVATQHLASPWLKDALAQKYH